ncbi:hypothetical protein E2C01_048626 [Portunus trituberculatus]|uniref:Uncharacterized protein n=1 Tax=Portunus trituberculatus TaxID=210409 RepID=A0A5B7G6Y4_PORTR|nr:hypothetical protein [Portunus trituberculatus]
MKVIIRLVEARLRWAVSEGLLFPSPPDRKPLPRVRKPNLHSDRGQDSNPCAWRPLGPQSTHGSSVPRLPHFSAQP